MSKFKTKTFEKFLSDAEIQKINEIMQDTRHVVRYSKSGVDDPSKTHMADYFYIDLNEEERTKETAKHIEIADILVPKIKNNFHPEIMIDDCHVIETVRPYSIHSDVLFPPVKEGYEPAWTIIIPLGNYFSNTFIFEQECPWTKVVQEWVAKENPPKLNVISDDMYNRYFTHCYRGDLEYLTIHDIFPWRKGWCNGTARSRFHSSDDHIGKLVSKRGIVMWTSIPKS